MRPLQVFRTDKSCLQHEPDCAFILLHLCYFSHEGSPNMPNVGIEGAHSTRVIATCYRRVMCLSWYIFFFASYLHASKASLSFKWKDKGGACKWIE